jgi:hypothetical protein
VVDLHRPIFHTYPFQGLGGEGGRRFACPKSHAARLSLPNLMA